MIWHSHMLLLEKAYKSETGYRVEYTNFNNTRLFFQWLVLFVDDNTTYQTCKPRAYKSSGENVTGCQKVHGNLVTVGTYCGGGLELNKNRYSVITWKLQEGREHFIR